MATSGSTLTRQRRVPPKPAPRPTAVRVRRRTNAARKSIQRGSKRVRDVVLSGYRGVEKPPHWRRRWRKSLARVVVYCGALVLVALVVRALWVVLVKGAPSRFPFGFDPDRGCDGTGYSCGVLSGVAMTFLSLGFATAVFFFYRLRQVRRPFVKRALDEPRRLVQTAGTIIGNVVGRDELCNVIMDDLKEREYRRPHVVVGGIGVGKTAVLVELTKRLAEKGAVPVPIRLRDAQKDLDFADLAQKRFMAEVGRTAKSDAEAVRAWRELRRDDQIVVLADGLEEALSEGGTRADGPTAQSDGQQDDERDNRVRVAMRAALRERLPLVVASRPHDALVGLEAAVVDLEPLGEEYALEYIQEGASTSDEHRLDWVIETADVTESPLFLQLAHELNKAGLLGYARPGQGDHYLDTRAEDRVGLRLRLLQTWTEALVSGHFYPEIPMNKALRQATVDQLGVLACVGLRKDSIEVKFADLFAGDFDGNLCRALKEHVRRLYETKEFRRERADEAVESEVVLKRELKLAATRGARLGLVEARGEGIRFQHSIMQAYLASRVIGSAIRSAVGKAEKDGAGGGGGGDGDEAGDDAGNEAAPTSYMEEALRHSGVELLGALVMHSRTPEGPADGQGRSRIGDRYGFDDRLCLRTHLVKAAGEGGRPDGKAIDLIVAALEIDSVEKSPRHRDLANDLLERWPSDSEDRTVEETKLKAMPRVGQVARKMAERAAHQRSGPRPAYDALYKLACKDVWYPVRLAAAQEIGLGGDHALGQLAGDWVDDQQSYCFTREKLAERLGPPRVKKKKKTDPSAHGKPNWKHEAEHRELVLRAWLAPLLVTSVTETPTTLPPCPEPTLGTAEPATAEPATPEHASTGTAATDTRTAKTSPPTYADHARRNLEEWLKYVGADGSGEPSRAPIALEIALAQGFKHAANRRRGRWGLTAAAHSDLAEHTARMLQNARFWFSRLTLVQALCLFALPDPEAAKQQSAEPPEPDRRLSKGPQARETDPRALIRHWLSSTAGGDEHPFVDEAGKLAVLALERNQPERYVWIDESGVVTKIGSRPPRSDARRKHNLWIPPSTGWSALDRRAQRLVADVLILLNLAERGTDLPEKREKRLRQAMRDDLPACITGERSYLDVDRTVGMVVTPTPGARCKDGCAFDLCPYPPKGPSQTYRVELSEAFCRRQQLLLGSWWRVLSRRTAPWQGAVPGELRKFWMMMEDRARR